MTLILIKSAIILVTFLAMEGVAWFTHKYIMHGFLWSWHKDHHEPHKGFFEKNDYFALVFSIPSIIFFMIGMNISSLWFMLQVGIGIACYGVFYVVFHDIIVHRRVKIKFLARSKYMKRMIRAHKIHHKTLHKEGAEAFGFLYAPKRFEAK